MSGRTRRRAARGISDIFEAGMATYTFKALDSDGKEVKGEQDAESEVQLFDTLKARGLGPISIAKKPPARLGALLRPALSQKHFARYVRQLATLLSAGVGLLESLDGLARSTVHPALRERTNSLRKELRAGGRLSAAIERHMPELPGYVARLAELGESTGKLPKSLADAAERLEYDEALRDEVRSALSYPLFLMTVGGAITIAMFLFVVPRFDALLGDDRSNVPAFSLAVIGFGVWLKANWGLAAGVVVLLVGGWIFLQRTQKELLQRAAEATPLVGRLILDGEVGGWARTVGLALANGASLLAALDLGEKGVRSATLRKGLREAKRSVRAGKKLDEALEQAVKLEPLVIDLIRTGGNSGALDEMLLFAAKIFESEAKERAKRLTALAEPVAILVIAAIVGGIVLSIVLAMTSLYDFDF